MKNKLIIRMSNNLGNQMFMYASAYAFAKKLGRELLIDDETAYQDQRNIYRYDLDVFNVKSKKASMDNKFLGKSGYLKRKTLKFLDKFNKSKNFYVEPKDKNKNTVYYPNAMTGNFKNTLYIEGHFETEKYFKDCEENIKKEFTLRSVNSFKNTQIYKDINNSNSVSICVRQNRFSERKRAITKKDDENSFIFTHDQIEYIKKAINVIKSKIQNPKFFLWSNDYKNLDKFFPVNEYVHVSSGSIHSDLYLMSQAKHFVVIPSSYNWWGAWLRDKSTGLILRPLDNNFRNFSPNNKDFWPNNWTAL